MPVLAHAAVFPAPDGPFKVKWDSEELVDEGRVDPFNASHPRRMMVSHFSPVSKAHCHKICRVPYMPPVIASIEDDILIDYLSDIGWPRGVLQGLELELCCETRQPQREKRKFPTLLFGTGLNTTRYFFSAIAQQVASLGYHVIVMDHPYETDVVLFPDGEIVFGGRIGRGANDTTALQFGLDVRAQDTTFVLNHFNIRKTAFIGQSYGGAGAALAMINETRILGGVNLDGIFWSREMDLGVPRPFLLFSSEGHNSSSDASFARFFRAMDTRHPKVWTRELSLKDSVHISYSDYSVIGDITGLRTNEELVNQFFGKVTGARVMEVMKAYLGDFVKFALEGKGKGLLAGPSPKYRDVSFLR